MLCILFIFIILFIYFNALPYCQLHIKDATDQINLETFMKLFKLLICVVKNIGNIFYYPPQDKLDFRDPIMVTLEFGLADEDKGPVLDGELPTSINKTVRCFSHSSCCISVFITEVLVYS